MFNGKLTNVFQSNLDQDDIPDEWAATRPASFDPLRQSDLMARPDQSQRAFPPTMPMSLSSS